LRSRPGPADVFEKALEKLWTHGGVIDRCGDNLSRGTEDWRDSYIAQGEQKQAQIEAMIRYAQSNQCRMSSLVRHFGDTADSQKPCGICDFCAPESCVAQRFRAATRQEQKVARAVLDSRARGNRQIGGKLHTELCSKNGMDRDAFEELMGAMARSGLEDPAGGFGLRERRETDSIPPLKASLTEYRFVRSAASHQ
jgi:hypothetical protein